MSPERVLIVSNLWSSAIGGGAEAHAVALSERLRARGHEVGAVTLGVMGSDVVGAVHAWPYRPDAFQSQSRARRAVFHAVDMYRPSTGRVLTDAIRRFEPTVVHSHAVAGLSSVALTEPARRGIAHVHTLHDYWLLCQRRSLTHRDGTRCEERCRGCRVISAVRNHFVERHPPDVVIAVSGSIAATHAQELPWLAARVRVVRNPTDPAPRTKVPHDGPITFGFIGRLTVEKGVLTLLDAYQRVELDGTRLVVAGDGPLLEETRAEGIPRVELMGWVDGAARERFFEEIDCLVVPSEWLDPAPLVVGEARMRGVPVIGASIGGIPELVAPNSTSLLFPPGDRDALSDRLRRFATAPGEFVDEGPGDLMTWDEHLGLVEQAYGDAITAAVSHR